MRFQPTQCHHDAVLGESDVLSLTRESTGEVVTAAVSGEFGTCDVWFRGPSAWVSDNPPVTARLYARHGDARVLIGQVDLSNTAHTEDGSGTVSAWVFAARGVPAQGFEVSCQRQGDAADLSGGQFFLRAEKHAAEPAVLATSGIAGLRTMTVSNVVQVQPIGAVFVAQSNASALQATVAQPTASALQATVVQSNASSLQATVTQTSPSALQAMVSQTNASALQATVVQSNASSLQATVAQSNASSLQATVAQGAAAGVAGRWPVYLTDGAVTLGTTTSPLYQGRIRDGAATYSAVSAVQSTPTSVAVKSLAYLWHPSTGGGSSKRVEIRRIVVSYGGGSGTGPVVFRATRINAVSGTPNGTQVSATPMDLGDAAGLTIMTGATSPPTRSGGDVFAITASAGATDTFVWQAHENGKPLVLRASMGEGIEVVADVKGNLTTAMQVTVSFEWVEV